jgi:hypothetical protein
MERDQLASELNVPLIGETDVFRDLAGPQVRRHEQADQTTQAEPTERVVHDGAGGLGAQSKSLVVLAEEIGHLDLHVRLLAEILVSYVQAGPALPTGDGLPPHRPIRARVSLSRVARNPYP